MLRNREIKICCETERQNETEIPRNLERQTELERERDNEIETTPLAVQYWTEIQRDI